MITKHCLCCGVILIKQKTVSVDYFVNKKKFCSVSCGAKSRKVSLKTRLKQSQTNKRLGRKPPKFSELTSEQKMIVKEKRALQPSPMLGKKHTKGAKLKNALAHKGEKSPTWKGGVTFSRNYKRMKKMEYLGRKYNAEGFHTFEQWEELKKFFNNMCVCCKQEEPNVILTEDHILPLSEGGSDNIENIQPLCMPCNSRKSVKCVDYRLLFSVGGVKK